MQRALTSQLGNQSGLDVISFQHFDALLFRRGETLKMFRPQTKRVIGGTARDRMIIGDFLILFEKDLELLRSPSTRYRYTNVVTAFPIANFPSLVASSMLVNDAVNIRFFDQIDDTLNALPNSNAEWIAKFGKDFFGSSVVDRCVEVVGYLRTLG
jgi:hypothetical protein